MRHADEEVPLPSGFDASEAEPLEFPVGIHHPRGDVKKINGRAGNATVSGFFLPGGTTHWKVDRWDDGTTEQGSSGSPLDASRRIRGQLNGGLATCEDPVDEYYGRVSVSLDTHTHSETGSSRVPAGDPDSESLQPHLDPRGTGLVVCNGTWLLDARRQRQQPANKLKSDDDGWLGSRARWQPSLSLADFNRQRPAGGHGDTAGRPPPAYPTPPPITPYQKSLLAKISAEAVAASEAAKPELLAALDTAGFRALLKQCCTEIAGLASAELLSELEAEFAVTKQVHNIRVGGGGGPGGGDVTVALGETVPYFPNLWDLKFIADAAACDEMQDDAEVQLFGFKPFAERLENATWQEAIQRPI